MKVIQTNIAINQDNKSSPQCNIKVEVININSLKEDKIGNF